MWTAPCRKSYFGSDSSNNYRLLCLDVDECSGSPCKNNATCMDLVNKFQCICIRGFTGKKCETGNVLLCNNILYMMYMKLGHTKRLCSANYVLEMFTTLFRFK